MFENFDWRFGRILLYSSFTPFLVVFTHALASHSGEDIELLRNVLDTLEAPRQTTEALNRLYQVCRVFLDFAEAFIPLQKPSFGFYNQADDSFTFPESGQTLSNSVSNRLFDMSMSNNTAAFEVGDDLDSMSTFLGNCLGENSAMTGLWNMDFSSSQWTWDASLLLDHRHLILRSVIPTWLCGAMVKTLYLDVVCVRRILLDNASWETSYFVL